MRILGLEQPEGQIKAKALASVLDALVEAAAATTRLAVTGRGGRRGPKPAWLMEAVDVTVTGLGRGSTTLGLEAPPLGKVSETILAQRELWETRPDPTETALDLVAKATAEARQPDASGEHFDGYVLRRLLAIEKSVGSPEVCCEMHAHDASWDKVVLGRTAWAQMKAHLNVAPAPRACIVTGRLDEIGHSKRWFRLRLTDGSSIKGHMANPDLRRELVRTYWGKPTTVQGTVHFRADGNPRIMEARTMSPRHEGDAIFEEAPGPLPLEEVPDSVGASGGPKVRLSRALSENARRFDWDRVWDSWPGDEPIEDLLAMLD